MKQAAINSKNGSALLMSLFFMVMTSSVAGIYVAYSSFDARLTERTIDQEKVRIAAESALDYGLVQLRDMVFFNQLTLSRSAMQSALDGIAAPAAVGNYVYTGPEGQSGFRISVEDETISGVITQGSAVVGSEGDYQQYTITAGARNPDTGVSAVLQEDVQAVGLPLIRFGVFYQEDLEIDPGADMTFSGPVHCNASMYISPDSANMFFQDRVTAHENMYRHRKDTSVSSGYVGINNSYDVETPMTIDSSDPNWMVQALNLWGGRVQSGAHGVQELTPPIANLDVPHDIIERTLPTNDANYHAATEAEKYMEKACLVIRVNTNGVLTATDCHGVNLSARFTNAVLMTNGTFSGMPLYAKTNGMYRFITNGAYSTKQTNFYDARELVWLRPVDIYVDQLIKAVPELASSTNYSIAEGRGLIYITRDDPDGPTNGVMPVVRLRNGQKILTNGLSVASDLPVYIEGDYNTTNKQTGFVAGDAVTMLSSAWQDAKSFGSLTNRLASNATYNVVMVTGNSETTTGHYNGGLENVMRFLENWTSKTVTFNGSVIDLWQAEIARGAWSYGGYYTAPTRHYGYDSIYRTSVPPGMTHVFGLEEIQWSQGSWN